MREKETTVDEPRDEWSRQLQETLSVLRKANPANHPEPEDIARLHELHARHEREAGRLERAEAAEERARHARANAGSAMPPDESDTSNS